jgi:hypothetical protein
MHGADFLFGIDSTYMGTIIAPTARIYKIIIDNL